MFNVEFDLLHSKTLRPLFKLDNTLTCLFDTGADIAMLRPYVLTQLGITLKEPIHHGHVSGVVSRTEADFYSVPELVLTQESSEIVLHDFPFVLSSRLSCDILLPITAVSILNVIIEAKTHKLRFVGDYRGFIQCGFNFAEEMCYCYETNKEG